MDGLWTPKIQSNPHFVDGIIDWPTYFSAFHLIDILLGLSPVWDAWISKILEIVGPGIVKRAFLEAQKYINNFILGEQLQLPSVENKPGDNPSTDAHNIPIWSDQPIRLDAKI